MKLYALISVLFISGSVFAMNEPTEQQRALWSKYYKISKIKDSSSGRVASSVCEKSKNSAKTTNCIDEVLFQIISLPQVNYSPRCSPDNLLEGFSKCGESSAQKSQWKRYNTRSAIRIKAANPDSRYCNNNGTMYGCPNARKLALETNCINQQIYDDSVAENVGPACTPNEDDDNILVGFCRCGCFEEGTKVLSLVDGISSWESIQSISESDYPVAHLSEDSDFPNFNIDFSSGSSFLSGDEIKKKMVIFTTSEGNVLKVTHDHAMVISTGEIIAAENVTMGHKFISSDGDILDLSDIQHTVEITNVKNLQTSEPIVNKKGHLILAEGIVVGDMIWQADLHQEVGAISIREF